MKIAVVDWGRGRTKDRRTKDRRIKDRRTKDHDNRLPGEPPCLPVTRPNISKLCCEGQVRVALVLLQLPWPPSSRGILSPALLTCLHHFVHVRRWPNLENVAVLQGRMLRHELYSMIHVPRFKDENAAEMFLGFRIRAVRGCDFAVLPVQGQGGLRRLKRFSTSQG